MNAGQQTTRRLVSGAGQSICRSCRDSISRNTYATAAAAVQSTTQVIPDAPPTAQQSPKTAYTVSAGVVLSRPPQITRDLHPFESAFFLYQRRLNERLALPFTRYFYVKKRTPADLEWKRKLKQRLTPARDIGRYKGYGEEAWNDEVIVGAKESDFEWQVNQLIEDAQEPAAATDEAPDASKKVEKAVVEKPMPRITEADIKGDVKSLNRLLQRTLYLLVKNKEGQWQFPQDVLHEEHLHGAARRILEQSSGVNMNTWVVGHNPIGHYQLDFPKASKNASGLDVLGAKTFFIKARIMAGQANLKGNKLGLSDFKWLSKEEIQKEVDKKYWSSIKNMLADR